MKKLLQLKGVYVYGKNYPRLSNINLTIKIGEKVALLGKSGAGKSTLVAVSNGSLKPATGEVIWNGIPLNKRTHRQRREIATLWQDLRLVEELSVDQNINIGELSRHSFLWAFGNLLGVIQSKTCLESLEATGLSREFIKEPIQILSGGQRQRVAVARLLNQQADLLIADEPLSNLDPVLTYDILQLLLNKKALKMIKVPETSIISLHRPELIVNFTRVIGLKNGELVLDCLTKDLKSKHVENIYED